MSGKKATTSIMDGDYALSVGKPDKELPFHWIWADINDIATLATGHTPSRNHPEYWDGNIPWMSVGDARGNHGGIIRITKEYTNQLGIDNSAAVLLPKGTVCLSRTASIGYAVILGQEMATSQGFVNWICSEYLNPRFLQLIFLVEKRFLYSISEGTAHTTIYFPEVKAFHIAFPHYAEQQRIVAKLDTLLGQLDRIKTRLDRIPQLLKDFRQKVLTQAVTGKLTEEWRKGNRQLNASDLLKNELNKRFEFWIENEKQEIELKGKKISFAEIKKKYKEPIKPLNLCFQEPDSWVKCTWDQLSNWITYGFTRPMPHVDKGIPIITVTNVRGGIIEFDTAENTTKNAFDSLNPKDKPKFGDILITKDGATLGRSAIVRTNAEFCIGQSVAVVWLRSTISDKNFLQFVIESSYIQDRIWEVARGMGMPHLSITDFRALTIGLPPLEEQQEIVRRVESLFSKADQIEASYQKLKAKIEQLPQALLAKAFRGELVEQLPTDGDARDLLEQIKQAKAGLEKGDKSRKMNGVGEVRMVAEKRMKYGKGNSVI